MVIPNDHAHKEFLWEPIFCLILFVQTTKNKKDEETKREDFNFVHLVSSSSVFPSSSLMLFFVHHATPNSKLWLGVTYMLRLVSYGHKIVTQFQDMLVWTVLWSTECLLQAATNLLATICI